MRLYNILKNIATDIKALLPSLKVNDASIKESLTPINLPLNSGISGYAWYYKKGTKVVVKVSVSGLPHNTWTSIATLPAGFRPYDYQYGVCNSTNATMFALYQLFENSGAIQVYSPNGYCILRLEFDAFN